jgi:hypothetical protein
LSLAFVTQIGDPIEETEDKGTLFVLELKIVTESQIGVKEDLV